MNKISSTKYPFFDVKQISELSFLFLNSRTQGFLSLLYEPLFHFTFDVTLRVSIEFRVGAGFKDVGGYVMPKVPLPCERCPRASPQEDFEI